MSIPTEPFPDLLALADMELLSQVDPIPTGMDLVPTLHLGSPGGQTLAPGHWWLCWALFSVLHMRSPGEPMHQPRHGGGTLQRGNLPEKRRDLPKAHTQFRGRARFEPGLPVSTACAFWETRVS